MSGPHIWYTQEVVFTTHPRKEPRCTCMQVYNQLAESLKLMWMTQQANTTLE